MQVKLISNLSPSNLEMLSTGMLLPVMEMFYSIQGEGFNTGKPASFVRIGGCDVGCHWCDVKESWDASIHPLTSIETIVEFVCSNPARAVVITGGEPLMYNLEPLCSMLHQQGIQLFLETSGAHPLTGQFDWICLSPKTGNPPLESVIAVAHELKVIIHDECDLQWAEEMALRTSAQCELYLQPEWSQHSMMLPLVVDYVKTHPKWMVSLQTHKFMNIP